MKNLRAKIAVLFVPLKMFRVFCFIRGNHVALEQVGRCLACGKTNGNEPKSRAAPINNRPVLVSAGEQSRRAAFVRNALISGETRDVRTRYFKGDAYL